MHVWSIHSMFLFVFFHFQTFMFFHRPNGGANQEKTHFWELFFFFRNWAPGMDKFVETGVAWKTVCGVRSSKTEVGPSMVLEAVVGWKGTWEDQNLWCSVEQQSLRSAENPWKIGKQRYGKNLLKHKMTYSAKTWSLTVERAWKNWAWFQAAGEPLRVKHMCDG